MFDKKNLNKLMRAQTTVSKNDEEEEDIKDNSDKEKEKILKEFLERKTYDFSQLERPSNYGEINKYWNYESNILDYRILDFTSKLK